MKAVSELVCERENRAALTGDLSSVSVDSLLSELRRRVLAGGQEAQSWPAGWASDDASVNRSQDQEKSGDLGR